MLGEKQSEAATMLFAAQFKPHGDGYLYYRSKDEPVMIDTAERDRFVAQFKSAIKGRFWLMVAVLIALLVWLTDFEVGMAGFVAGAKAGLAVCGISAALLFQFAWAWTIPARALRGRCAEAIRKE